MAFEIGERITSSFTGPGTIVGPLERDEDNTAVQRVEFDNPIFGTKLREVGKMQPLDEEDEPKAKVERKAKVHRPKFLDRLDKLKDIPIAAEMAKLCAEGTLYVSYWEGTKEKYPVLLAKYGLSVDDPRLLGASVKIKQDKSEVREGCDGKAIGVKATINIKDPGQTFRDEFTKATGIPIREDGREGHRGEYSINRAEFVLGYVVKEGFTLQKEGGDGTQA